MENCLRECLTAHVRNLSHWTIRNNGNQHAQVPIVLQRGLHAGANSGLVRISHRDAKLKKFFKFLELILVWALLRGILDEAQAAKMTKSKTQNFMTNLFLSVNYISRTAFNLPTSVDKSVTFLQIETELSNYIPQHKNSDRISGNFLI